MVAILWCDGDVVERLGRLAAFNKPLEYTEAWRWGDWKGRAAHLALLIADDAIRWLGRVRGGKHVTNLDRTVGITEIEEIEPISLRRLGNQLPEPHNDAAQHRGILTPATGAAVVAALRELLPAHGDLITHLGRPTENVLPRGPRGELLNQQRDAVGMLLNIGVGSTGRGALRSWSLPPVEAPFLAGMSAYAALEDSLISHDVDRFASWVEAPSVQVAWRAFSEGRRRMFIMNANRTAVEHTLGVDVVYYNETRHSFVLVQYKKMRREPIGTRGALFYRPDDQLAVELDRMGEVDSLCVAPPGEFRLLSKACWLKLCDPDSRIEDPAALIKGMYFAREHLEELLTSCRGPRNGTRIGYDNVQRYLNNTMFTDLVADGWIGSHGPATTEIGRLIRESLETGHAVVVGIQSDPRP